MRIAHPTNGRKEESKMFRKIHKIINSFWGALLMGVFTFYVMLTDIAAGKEGWAFVMGLLVLYWVFTAYRALKTGEVASDDDEVTVDTVRERLIVLKQMHRDMGRVVAKEELKLLKLEKEAEETSDGTE
jgi:hypothetical protein